jgi:sec-independent protein translocase protein TatA
MDTMIQRQSSLPEGWAEWREGRCGVLCVPLAFLAGGPGPFELAVIFAAVLLLFGAKRLPEFARTLGRVVRELRRASEDFRAHLMDADAAVRAHARDMVDTGDSRHASAPFEPDADAEYPEQDPEEKAP